jgi:type IV secretory pathway VirJ component
MRRPVGWMALAIAGLLATFEAAQAQDKPVGLQLQLHEAARPNHTLLLLLSGDGGWGDLEEAVTNRFNQAGISVVGLNSRRYFFSGSSPTRLAHDLQRILAYYGQQWHARRLILAGYSFGADALPFAWEHLPTATRQKTDLIALIGLQPAANFSISIWEMLDLPAADDTPVELAVRNLPMSKVICVHGVDDGEACTLPVLKHATRIARPGGHDFDGDYDGVAEAVLKRIGKR